MQPLSDLEPTNCIQSFGPKRPSLGRFGAPACQTGASWAVGGEGAWKRATFPDLRLVFRVGKPDTLNDLPSHFDEGTPALIFTKG